MIKKKIYRRKITLLLGLISSILYTFSAYTNSDKSYDPNPTKEQCGAGLSKYHVRTASLNQELACMKKGFKHIYWGSPEDKNGIDPSLKKFYKSLSKLTAPQPLPPHKTTIWYTPSGKHNALLLQKYLIDSYFSAYFIASQKTLYSLLPDQSSAQKVVLLKELYWQATGHNPCIMGTLLGYAPEDTLFLYQWNAYRNELTKNLLAKGVPRSEINTLTEKLMNTTFDQWPKENQESFNTIISENTEWQQEYNFELQLAEAWLKINQHHTSEELAHYGNAFKDLFNKIMEPVPISTPPQKPIQTQIQKICE